MSTKKLQIITPIVTSVNGKTGDVTLDISGSGGTTTTMKKLTFTGGAIGEYDGSSDVNVTIPKDLVYGLSFTQNEDNTYTVENDYDEIIAANDAGKIIMLNGDVISITGRSDIGNSSEKCQFLVNYGSTQLRCELCKGNKILTITNEYNYPTIEDLSNSGSVYWDKDKKKWTINDVNGATDSVFIVKFTKSNEVVSCDKTVEQINEAYTANKQVIGLLEGLVVPLIFSSTTFTVFNCLCYEARYLGISIYNDGPSWYYRIDQLVTSSEVPSYKAGNGISISANGTISVTAAKMYSGTGEPSADIGSDGDLYLDMG